MEYVGYDLIQIKALFEVENINSKYESQIYRHRSYMHNIN